MSKSTQIWDHREHHRWLSLTLLRFQFRRLFGELKYCHCGFFLDHNLSRIVHEYGYFVEYPSGDQLIEGHSEKVWSLAFSKDGRYLYTGQHNGVIALWDLQSLEKLTDWEAHPLGTIESLLWHRNQLISASDDKTIRIWDAFTQELIRTLKGHTHQVWSISIDDSGTRLLSSSRDRTVREWSLNSGVCVWVYSSHTKPVCTAISSQSIIVSGSWDRSIKMFDIRKKKLLHTITEGVRREVNDLRFNCDGSLLTSVSVSTVITVYKWPEMRVIREIPQKSLTSHFHPNHPCLLACDDRKTRAIKVLDVSNGECIRNLEGHTDRVVSIRWSPDGFRLISVSDDQSVRIWDVSSLYQSD